MHKQCSRYLSLLASVCLAAGASVQAQPGGGQSRDPGADLARIFGKSLSFSATAHTVIKNPSGEHPQEIEFAYAMLDGKVRTEMDMTKMMGHGANAGMATQMQKMGMDWAVHIFDPGRKIGYMIYPGMKAYCEMPVPNAPAESVDKPPKIERTDLGKDTVDGHPCVKYKVTITQDNGTKHKALVWEATDLKNYPIQTQVEAENGTTVTTLFKDINTAKPDAALFEPPSGFKRYGNVQEMMMGSMQQMMQGAGRKGDE